MELTRLAAVLDAAKRATALLAGGALLACSHPIEIVGKGDVVSASNTRNCSYQDFHAGVQQCTENLVVGEYEETYFAVAHQGWQFSHWQNQCEDENSPICSFAIPAEVVSENWGKTMPPLVAVFTEVAGIDYPYGLPDPLVNESGARITSSSGWNGQRRPETLSLFATHIYGHTPGDAFNTSYTNQAVDNNALGGNAIRKQVRVVLSTARGSLGMDVLLYLPKQGSGPYPVFLGLNFRGNHTVSGDTGIRIPQSWVGYTSNNQASAADRGMNEHRWPIEEILARGYGLATVYCGDIDPDYDDGFQNGVHPLFYNAGESRPADDEWGTIGAWAWGLSRALDYLQTQGDVDGDRVAVMGFSRLGKTALWAAAQDPRFALAVSNTSGTLGASLSRRIGVASGKETISRISSKYGYWFARNLAQYANNPGQLPVDQHQLIALMAPRPAYIASAQNDAWADPQGEYEAGYYAGEVYKLFGLQGLSSATMPPLNSPRTSIVGYHIRSGDHEVTLYDWQRYLDFADHHFQ